MSYTSAASAKVAQNFERLYESLLTASSSEQVYALALDGIQELLEADSAFVLLPESQLLASVGENEFTVGTASDAVITMYLDGHAAGKFVLRFAKPRSFSEMEVIAARLIAMHAVTAIRQLKQRQSMAMVVHELRGPLHSIKASVDMLRSDVLQRRETAMDIIDRNSRVQARLIDDLLSLSRIQTGKLSLRSQEVYLAAVLREAVEAARPKAFARGTCIIFEETLGRALVQGDEDRLKQVFWNLLSNAVRFSSPNGCVQVQTSADNGYVEIRIRDNGIGIGPDAFPFIFEPFHQAARLHSAADDGLGLGLPIAKELVELHGGTLSAESDGVQKGATFTVRLKLK